MASRVGKYLLFETLGEGAFGKVKLGVHEETGEQVAVKIMDKSDIKAQEMTMNVRREIAIMKALKHRNIVNLRQVLTSHTKLYIVMDLVTGGELFTKILKEGSLEEKIARRYFQQLVDGIDYCHKRGVCHRDLKPENLLIDETTGELKITDFGLSAMKGASTTEELLHTQCGSPNYCAPEIIARHKQGYNGTKVDAWSCGIILFALLAGFLPFYDENTKVLYNMIRYNEVKFPRKFPREARDLVLCLLHKEPDKRLTLPQVKKHPWFAVGYVGDDAPPKSIGSGSSPPGRPRRRRHKRGQSLDQAPRSREFPGIRKSDRTDPDSGPSSATGVPTGAFPDGHAPPVPPPIVDVGTRIPAAQRPPAPRSPISPTVAPPLVAPSPVAPPPPPPPTPPPPTPPPVITSTASPHHQIHGPSAPSTEPPEVIRFPPTERAVPPYPSEAEAKEVDRAYAAKRKEVDRAYAAKRKEIDRSNATSLLLEDGNSTQTNKLEARIDGMHVDVNGTRPPAAYLPGKNLAPKPPAFPAPELLKADPDDPRVPSTSQTVRDDTPVSNVETTSATPPTKQLGAGVPGYKEVWSMDDGNSPTAVGDSKRANVESPTTTLKSRWNVVVTPPSASTFGSSMAPVTTPAALADGDASWVKKLGEGPRGEDKLSPPKASALREVKQVKKSDVVPILEKASGGSHAGVEKPLSIVEQRRLMYNNLAREADVPPPLPDTSLRGSRSDSSNPIDDNELSSGQRFGDRAEKFVVTGYPTLNGSRSMDEHNSGSATRGGASGTAYENQSAPLVTSDGRPKFSNAGIVTPGQEASTPVQSASTESKTEGSTMESATDVHGNAPVHLKTDPYSVPVLDEGEAEAPLKERLTAALARYRRIFKLGNKIGITSSPSFSSNKGGGPGDSSGDEDPSKLQTSGRSNFFARAKTVTGAWGIILTQGLEEDSDSEDEGPQVTEDELQAFSRLLDFWDNRRASASVTSGGEVLLDDENSSPLSEADILSIQSLLQKLEPKQVEDEMTEVADDVTAAVPAHGMEDSAVSRDTDDLQDLAVQDIHVSSPEKMAVLPAVPDADVPVPGNTKPEANKDTITPMSTEPPPSPPPPPLPSLPPIPGRTSAPNPRVPPFQNDALRNDGQGVSWDRSSKIAGGTESSVPPSPAPPPSVTSNPTSTGAPVVRFPPPPYNSKDVAEPETPRLAVTPSTVRDPFRPPRAPPAYPPPQNPVGRPGSSSRDSDDSNSKTSSGKPSGAHQRRGGRLPGRASQDARRKSSTTAPDIDTDGRRTTSRDSGRGSSGRDQSNASVTSTGSGGLTKRGHVRSLSRDEHATRGLFSFGMFNRRKSSAMTSFDSDLAPDRCLLEVGRILTGMGCNVMVKQGENKMKCEAPLKQEKLFISITCTQEKKVSTVHFRRGRKDRSHVDAREFYEFFQVVHSRFQDRVQPDASP